MPGITATCADLEGGPWPYDARRFDGIVVATYLHRPLFPAIGAALADGGVLIYETFMRGQERLGKPSNPDFLLEPGELLQAFPTLTVLAFEQGRVETPSPAVVQRVCAMRGVRAEALPLPPGQLLG